MVIASSSTGFSPTLCGFAAVDPSFPRRPARSHLPLHVSSHAVHPSFSLYPPLAPSHCSSAKANLCIMIFGPGLFSAYVYLRCSMQCCEKHFVLYISAFLRVFSDLQVESKSCCESHVSYLTHLTYASQSTIPTTTWSL